MGRKATGQLLAWPNASAPRPPNDRPRKSQSRMQPLRPHRHRLTQQTHPASHPASARGGGPLCLLPFAPPVRAPARGQRAESLERAVRGGGGCARWAKGEALLALKRVGSGRVPRRGFDRESGEESRKLSVQMFCLKIWCASGRREESRSEVFDHFCRRAEPFVRLVWLSRAKKAPFDSQLCDFQGLTLAAACTSSPSCSRVAAPILRTRLESARRMCAAAVPLCPHRRARFVACCLATRGSERREKTCSSSHAAPPTLPKWFRRGSY